MNAATRGVILAIAAVIIGVIVLGQGFDDQSPTLTTAPATSGDGGGAVEEDDGNGDDSSASTDDNAAASDDSGDDSGAATDDGGEEPATDDAGETADGAADADGSAGADDGTDTPSILHPPGEVRVLVANGTTVAGAAGRTADQLQADRGYNSLTPTNTTAGTSVESSSIYYAPGYELDARQIAQILNAAPDAVAPMPADPPVGDLLEAHVLVVLGPDLVSG